MPKNKSIVFRRWSNKRYAVLTSFHKEIRIATLSLASILVQLQPLLAQTDTVAPSLHYELEEVESVSQQDAELDSPLLRQLLIIRQDQLELNSPRSLPDLLNRFAGVDIRTRGSHGVQSDLSIQGGSFDQSMVLLNGVDMTNPQTGHFNLDLPLDISMAKRLEILKGPASKKYGLSAYTGAINVVTDPGDSLHVNAHAAFGQFNTYKGAAAIHLPSGRTRHLITASAAGSDGYSENTDYSMKNMFLHSVFSEETFRTDLMLGWGIKNFGANAFYTPRFPEQYEETSAFTGALKLENRGPLLSVKGKIWWNRHTDYFTLFRNDPDLYQNHHRTDVAGMALESGYSSKAGYSSVSVQYRHDRILSTTLGVPLEVPVEIRNVQDVKYEKFKSRDHLYATADHTVQFGRIYMNAGVLFHAGAGDLVSPGIYPGFNLAYDLSEQLSAFASINRSMRLPTFTDLYYEGPQNKGNPTLRPESSVTTEAGLKYSGQGFKTEGALFFRKGSETIDWIWMDTIWQTKNLGELNAYGGEINFWLFPHQLINGRAKRLEHFMVSYSYTVLSQPEGTYISNYALDQLRHKVTLDMRILLPMNIFIDAGLVYQDRNGSFFFYETPSSTPYEKSYDPFWLSDLSVGIQLHKISIYASATNLFNTSYRDIGSVIMPGRWIMTGIRFR